ncbi:hypothetical protein [Acinetobacter sp. YH01012]|uniref:hypothetical protein n=1 Tax=Acinetobacter sp. YH01012 TaxID=2601028 RepID=UPI0015D18BEF|nr:hypothetical protein [Acinetobacter sp. YH01012]
MKAKVLLATVLSICTSSVFAYDIGFNEKGQFGAFDKNGNKMTWKETLIAQKNLMLQQMVPGRQSAASNQSSNSSIQLNSLNANELLPTLFGRIQLSGRYRSSELEYPFIAVQQKIDDQNEIRFLQQHPTLTYQNAQNQTRYFVFVESMPTFNGQDVNQGHGSYTKGYLLNFKKTANGKFELTNPQAQLIDIPSSYGSSHMQIEDIQKDFRRLGKNVMGAIFVSGFTSGGTTESSFHMLSLQDHEVEIKRVGDAGMFGSRYIKAKNDEVEYGYAGKYKVVDTNKDLPLYPIEITYSTTNLNLKDKNDYIVEMYKQSLSNKGKSK